MWTIGRLRRYWPNAKGNDMTPLEFVAKVNGYLCDVRGDGLWEPHDLAEFCGQALVDLPRALNIIEQLVRERDEARAALKAMQPGCHDVAEFYEDAQSEWHDYAATVREAIAAMEEAADLISVNMWEVYGSRYRCSHCLAIDNHDSKCEAGNLLTKLRAIIGEAK